MKFIYIVGIIILTAETECFIEDTTGIKISEEQRTLLSKLQNSQDPKDEKPLTWNEILADVLVNRIKIFSFNKVDDSSIVNEYNEPSKPGFITNCFSEVLFVFKKYVYDKWSTNYEEPEFSPQTTQEPKPVVKTITARSDVDDPNNEIEIIEPRYHGKLKEADSDETGEKNKCPEGSMKDDKGICVKEISKLLIAVPRQCPAGYRPDRLGNCRMIFF